MASALAAFCLFAGALPAVAQDDDGAAEVIVTGSRASYGYAGNSGVVSISNSKPAPALRLRRSADFAVQTVRIVGDTRDEAKRRAEIYAMVERAIGLAGKNGVELSTGDYIVEPLTKANYRNLLLEEDDERDDAESATFLVKVRLVPGMSSKGALERIASFVKAVPAVGRAELIAEEELTLSVVAPDQYRGAIIDLVAADAAKATTRFGPGYAVTVTGLDRPVEWARVGLTDVSLYLPVSYSIVPNR